MYVYIKELHFYDANLVLLAAKALYMSEDETAKEALSDLYCHVVDTLESGALWYLED